MDEQKLEDKSEKSRRFKKANKSGMNEDMVRYLDIEQVVKRKLGDTERVYVNGILQNGLNSGNNKPFWKYVKSQKRDYRLLIKSQTLYSQFKSVFAPHSANTFPQLPCTQCLKLNLYIFLKYISCY